MFEVFELISKHVRIINVMLIQILILACLIVVFYKVVTGQLKIGTVVKWIAGFGGLK